LVPLLKDVSEEFGIAVVDEVLSHPHGDPAHLCVGRLWCIAKICCLFLDDDCIAKGGVRNLPLHSTPDGQIGLVAGTHHNNEQVNQCPVHRHSPRLSKNYSGCLLVRVDPIAHQDVK